MTSSHHGPYDQGYTRATMAHTKRSDLARASGPHKVRRSPDWSLQLDSMKSESLVIVDQNATVNTFPGSKCRGRPQRCGFPKGSLYRCCMAVVSSCREVFG